jgi:hypothetical protein
MIVFYNHNRIPHRILKNVTSEESFFGKKPSVEHLRVFGCPIYIYVTKDKINKLEPSGKKGIFVLKYCVTAKNILIHFCG